MRVAVLMSTYNGEKFLHEQLDSIFSQRGVTVDLYVRDDGSDDHTTDILEVYRKNFALTWYSGSNIRPAKSFWELIHKVPDTYDYYAFADQDDIWKEGKLQRAISGLKKYSDRPAMYYSSFTMVDRDFNILGNSVFVPVKNLKQSLITCQAIGCSMVFNKALLRYLKQYDGPLRIMHDNLVYKVCRCIGGRIIYDKNSFLYYRQHDDNVIGGRNDLRSDLGRLKNMFFRKRNYRSRALIDIYDCYKNDMDAYTLKTYRTICNYKKLSNRIRLVFDSGYRLHNIRIDGMFVISVLLGFF